MSPLPLRTRSLSQQAGTSPIPAARMKMCIRDRLITVSCAEGDTGFIYDGELDFDVAVTEVGLSLIHI